MMSPDSVPSATPRNKQCEEEEVCSVCSGDSEEEVEIWSGPLNKECDETNSNKDGKEATEFCEDGIEEPKKGMTFDTPEEAYLYYKTYAKGKGFAVARRTSRKGKDGKLTDVGFECSRAGKPRKRTRNPVKPRPQTKIGCPAHVTVVVDSDGKWRLNRVNLEHNHEQSPGKSRFFKSNRVLPENVKKKLELNDQAGIKLNKTFDSFKIEAGGADELTYSQRDCRNYLDKLRRLRLVEGDAEAMHSYFMRMKADNSNFFFAMDLNDKGRLRNVFWADARSRATCKEFGDVVTFDTTYLVNKFDMPFAPFVGVNHHGQSILLGCGLISHEDTESFSWLFQTWKTCMGCAPKAIITDQCLAMKNAIECVFPDTRHRWCIWHIMKKVTEKLNGYKDYEKIGWAMRKAVYNSLTEDEFEDAWNGFMKKYDLEGNAWLEGLYREKKRWVPAYLNDCFWAGMSSTQRSESMNAYFDGYIHSKTTLKQFVEQYENALANKVESEKLEDMKSWNSYIPLITKSELEKQFQGVYTNAKVTEFHEQFAVGRLELSCNACNEDESKFEVKEWVTFGEGEERQRKRVSFTVTFDVETNETQCKCRLFESKGMVCRHQLMVWNDRGIEKVSEKYILRRWCKNVKKAHTKIRISYDKSSDSIEARQRDNLCNLFNEVADLAEDSQEKYEKVMARVNEVKQELMEDSAVCDSNVVSLGDDTGPRIDSLGDGVLLSQRSTNILDPEGVRRKGRPPCKRKQGLLEKVIKKTIATKKKTLSKGKIKEVDKNAVAHGVGTQESVVNVNGHPTYMGHSMWPKVIPQYMQANIAQGGSIIPFSPTFCPTGTSMPQFMPSFPSSQSNMVGLINGQVWNGQSTIAGSQVWNGQSTIAGSQVWNGQSTIAGNQVWNGQSTIAGNQVWGGGGQSSSLGDRSQYWGGPQPSLLQSQGQESGGQPSYLEMMNATSND